MVSAFPDAMLTKKSPSDEHFLVSMLLVIFNVQQLLF